MLTNFVFIKIYHNEDFNLCSLLLLFQKHESDYLIFFGRTFSLRPHLIIGSCHTIALSAWPIRFDYKMRVDKYFCLFVWNRNNLESPTWKHQGKCRSKDWWILVYKLLFLKYLLKSELLWFRKPVWISEARMFVWEYKMVYVIWKLVFIIAMCYLKEYGESV